METHPEVLEKRIKAAEATLKPDPARVEEAAKNAFKHDKPVVFDIVTRHFKKARVLKQSEDLAKFAERRKQALFTFRDLKFDEAVIGKRWDMAREELAEEHPQIKKLKGYHQRARIVFETYDHERGKVKQTPPHGDLGQAVDGIGQEVENALAAIDEYFQGELDTVREALASEEMVWIKALLAAENELFAQWRARSK
jgi:hypothetical protein